MIRIFAFCTFTLLLSIIRLSFFQGIEDSKASFLISIIGIINTVGRVGCGFIADFPWVDSLLLNNICLIICTLSVAAVPICSTYVHYIIMCVFFGLAVCKYFFIFKFLRLVLIPDRFSSRFLTLHFYKHSFQKD